MTSWTRVVQDLPQSIEEMTAKLGEIYFRTDEDALDDEDEQALDKLCGSLKALLKERYSFHLLCIGHADHRATESYNYKLGNRRAEAVKRHIIALLPEQGGSVCTASEGELQSAQPGRSRYRVPAERMALDRRVDIHFRAVVPPVRIGMTGNWIHTSTLEKMELNNLGRIFVFTAEAVTVLITTHYEVVSAGGKNMAKVVCVVTRTDTKEPLFTASASLDADEITMIKAYKTHPDSAVARALLPGSDPPPAATYLDVRDRAGTAQARDLVPVIYQELKGKHRSISERIRELFRKAAVS
jgi:hypothetical protein